MVFRTSGGACIVIAEKGNSEKKAEKNLFDDLAFKKLILENNDNNEVSLSTLVFQNYRGQPLIRASLWACQGLLGIYCTVWN